jgi:predicted MFS family arabinose efflux permease
MAVGIGASLSNLLAGVIVKHASYNAAFATMGAIAVAACALFFFLVPETKPDSAPSSEVALAPA